MSRKSGKGRRKPKEFSRGLIQIGRHGRALVSTAEGAFRVPKSRLHGAMDGDLVEVQRMRHLEDRRRKQQRRTGAGANAGAGSPEADGLSVSQPMLGSVHRVLERAHATVVGSYQSAGGLGIVSPNNPRIVYDVFIDVRSPLNKPAKDGDVVVVRLTEYPSRYQSACGYVEEVIGHQDDSAVGIEAIIREHGLETLFSDAALAEADALPDYAAFAGAAVLAKDDAWVENGPKPGHQAPTLPASQPKAEKLPKQPYVDDVRDWLLRRDLRQRLVLTIDPEDARDFDDALSLDYVDGQMRLGVHIADVSAYVAWDSAIDLQARRRATSSYLPDRVIPMLPHQLSDQLCSLRPNEDKLAFTVDMLIGSDGSVLDTQLYPSLIRSAARLDYGQVQRLLDGGGTDAGPHALPKPVTDRLFALDGLARKLLSRRLSRGAIDFDSQEAKLSLDADGRPLQVTLRQKTAATSLVEEAMILANEQVAAYMLGLQAPMAYRIHDQPLSATLAELVPTLAEFGYITKAKAPESSKDIQAILEASADRPEHYLISSLLLRAMKQACYSSVYSGHFGLASSGYCHFTSPIRRYPDLMAHRLLRYQLAEKPPPPGMLRQLDWICRHCSQMERASELATRQATALKLCEYLGPCINEVFDTIIVSVSSFGLGLKEQSTTAEGDIQAADLPPGYGLDLGRQRFFDPSSNLSLRLGQPLRARLAGVDPSRMRLRFVIA